MMCLFFYVDFNYHVHYAIPRKRQDSFVRGAKKERTVNIKIVND